MEDGVKPGLKVKTNAKLGTTEGWSVERRHMRARRRNALGVVENYVPGHGGDVWFVKHEGGAVAVYGTDEFEPAETT